MSGQESDGQRLLPLKGAARLMGVALLGMLLALLLPLGAKAHGGGASQLVNEPVGPYLVSVWTSPEPAAVGEVHLTISVAETNEAREVGEPVLGADVTVVLEPPTAEGAVVQARASNENATNKLFYEADVTLPVEGSWTVTILVEGPEGAGEANFEMELVAGGQNNWLLWGGVAVAVTAAVFVVQSYRRRGE